MKPRAKNFPRLWCALQGLLPLEACLAAQRGELAWPPEQVASAKSPVKTVRVAANAKKAAASSP